SPLDERFRRAFCWCIGNHFVISTELWKLTEVFEKLTEVFEKLTEVFQKLTEVFGDTYSLCSTPCSVLILVVSFVIKFDIGLHLYSLNPIFVVSLQN
ncbi:MAG: hypothetical protein RRY36_10500, partial [Bacteroidaceae bacterium]